VRCGGDQGGAANRTLLSGASEKHSHRLVSPYRDSRMLQASICSCVCAFRCAMRSKARCESPISGARLRRYACTRCCRFHTVQLEYAFAFLGMT
jgi:hypothetical protein